MTGAADTNPLLEAALDYARRGWSVVPVRAGAKAPIVRWEPLQREVPEAAQIAEWWARWPDANVGVVTGRVSGVAVLDVDPRHGGATSLARLEALHGALPLTVEAKTGGGGRHLYFAMPEPPLRNRVGIADGIDIRGEGGMIVAPPSLHPSGRRYVWVSGHEPESLPLAVMPGWLAALARGEAGRLGHPLAHWRHLVHEGVPEGQRNSTIASLAGHLLWRGVDPEVAGELLLGWNRLRCRPPLDDAEVAAVVESIWRLHQREAAQR